MLLQITHRRLAVRNVLLKNEGINGLVAKLIGFGNFGETGSDAEEGAAVGLYVFIFRNLLYRHIAAMCKRVISELID